MTELRCLSRFSVRNLFSETKLRKTVVGVFLVFLNTHNQKSAVFKNLVNGRDCDEKSLRMYPGTKRDKDHIVYFQVH